MRYNISALNRLERRLIRKKLAGQSFEKQWRYLQRLACEKVWPITDHEEQLSSEILANSYITNWYHGGRAGREIGEILIPPKTEAGLARGGHGLVTNSYQAVYFTRDFDLAQKYARAVKGGPGQVYVVEPIGKITADSNDLRAVTFLNEIRSIRESNGDLKDWLFDMAFCAPSAKVVEVCF